MSHLDLAILLSERPVEERVESDEQRADIRAFYTWLETQGLLETPATMAARDEQQP